MPSYYEYRHTVSFEETNLVGNVYFTNYLKWQGRCRELFLRDHAPGVLAAFTDGLCLVTARCTCDYFKELSAFDEVIIRMRLDRHGQNRLVLLFEYWCIHHSGEELVARGEQHIVAMKRSENQPTPIPLPADLIEALRKFE